MDIDIRQICLCRAMTTYNCPSISGRDLAFNGLASKVTSYMDGFLCCCLISCLNASAAKIQIITDGPSS